MSTHATEDDTLLAFGSETDAPMNLPNTAGIQPRRNVRRLGRSHSAIAILALIAATQAVLIAMWLQQSDRTVTATVPDTGTITISSEPPGALVTVDGEARGATPLHLSLPAGEHEVTLENGADIYRRPITVAGGRDATLHVERQKELKKEPTTTATPMATTGTLQIDTEPPGGTVSVDGRVRGSAPVTLRNLAPGSHLVTVIGPGGTLRQTAIVKAGSVSSVMIAATPQHASGWLAIESRIPLQVYEGGTLVGSTETSRIMLSAARHNLELVNTAFNFRVNQTVQIAPGKTTSLSPSLPNGTLHINALPWAEVSIGGRALGETPIANVAVPIGSHELVFRHPELGEHRKTVEVRVGSPVRVGIDLQKAQR